MKEKDLAKAYQLKLQVDHLQKMIDFYKNIGRIDVGTRLTTSFHARPEDCKSFMGAFDISTEHFDKLREIVIEILKGELSDRQQELKILLNR